MYLVPEGREEIGIRWGRGKKCSGPYAWTPMHITVTESIPMHAAISSGNILKCTCQKTNEVILLNLLKQENSICFASKVFKSGSPNSFGQ